MKFSDIGNNFIFLTLAVLACSCAALPDAANASAGATGPEAKSPASSGLHYAKEPSGGAEAVAAALRKYYRPEFRSVLKPELADRSKLEIQSPIAYYSIAAGDALGASGLEQAKINLYAYYIKVSGKIEAMIRLTGNGDGTFGGPWAYVESINERQQDGPFYQGLEKVAMLDQVRSESYELRILALPPYKKAPVPLPSGEDVHGVVFWLKSNKPGDDLIYTMPDSPQQPGLEPDMVYSVQSMLTAIRPGVEAFQEDSGSR